MTARTSYRTWIRWGCAAACAALIALPGMARASKYDADLAPLSARTPILQVAPAKSVTPAPAAAQPAVNHKGRSSAGPSWLSGGASKRHGRSS